MASFDRINHEALLKKLKMNGKVRQQIKSWLKSGVIDKGACTATSEGTPQGGVISPLLANIALHGLEEILKKYAKTLNKRDINRYQVNRQIKEKALSIIRYADDFVVLHEDKTVVQRCREIISEWLLRVGLELKPENKANSYTPTGI